MDALARLLSGSGLQANYGVDHDFWYQPVGVNTPSGMRIDSDGAMKISAWFRGREILATALAMLPLHLMERLAGEGGAEPARSHPLYDTLHRKPNAGDDSFTWRRQKMCDLIDGGWTYDRIAVGQRWALEPIAAGLVTPEKIKRGPYKGRMVFHVRDEVTQQSTTLTQDEVFYLRTASGKGILEHARDSLGLARVTDTYAGKVFGNGTLNAGMIEVPAPMDVESARALALSFKTAVGDWHMPRVLPLGAKWNASDALTPEKAQMLLSRKFSINDIARWLGLPPHMLGDLDRATFSNIEHQGQEFVTYSLGPWLSLFEFGINDQLVLQPNRFYAEFTRDALVRGDIATRWQAWHTAVTDGVVTRNEVRRKENWKALPGLDEPLTPAHIVGKQDDKPASSDPDEANRASRAELITQESAARLLRKEIAAVQKAAVRHAGDSEAFAVEVSEFYAKHVALVMSTLQMSQAQAEGYCASQCGQVLGEQWLAALELWNTSAYAAGLAAIALEEAA